MYLHHKYQSITTINWSNDSIYLIGFHLNACILVDIKHQSTLKIENVMLSVEMNFETHFWLRFNCNIHYFFANGSHLLIKCGEVIQRKCLLIWEMAKKTDHVISLLSKAFYAFMNRLHWLFINGTGKFDLKLRRNVLIKKSGEMHFYFVVFSQFHLRFYFLVLIKWKKNQPFPHKSWRFLWRNAAEIFFNLENERSLWSTFKHLFGIHIMFDIIHCK